jgi:hypothetical protein
MTTAIHRTKWFLPLFLALARCRLPGRVLDRGEPREGVYSPLVMAGLGLVF